jgi:hypothetical protein
MPASGGGGGRVPAGGRGRCAARGRACLPFAIGWSMLDATIFQTPSSGTESTAPLGWVSAALSFQEKRGTKYVRDSGVKRMSCKAAARPSPTLRPQR